MAQQPERNVQQSLLDRLIDLEPHSTVDPPVTRSQSLRELRASVKRQVEWTLNSVRTIEEVPAGCRELRKSLFFYGFPDVTTMALDGAQDEQRMLHALENAISQFEPRLTRVRVTSYERLSRKRAAIQFHLEALLMIEPAPERISFDTVLEVSRGSYQVKDQQNA
jgi:type VI secretion system protein ImpF